MKTALQLIVFLSLVVSSIAQDQFITRWQLAPGQTTITFDAATNGPVDYSWTTIPAGSSGIGFFSSGTPVILSGFPAGAEIQLSCYSANLKYFALNDGPDASRLMDVVQWGTSQWSSMEGMFWGCNNLQISAADVPNLSNVTSMASMFRNASSFNQSINNWNTINVQNMSSMFRGATLFNQALDNWVTDNVVNMSGMFASASNFNQPIENWNTANVADMSEMFSSAISFDQDISGWNTSNVTNMSSMFNSAVQFNQPIGSWNTAMVNDMSFMFNGATMFNQALDSWITDNVTNMFSMFYAASNFDQELNSWNVASVLNMGAIFREATAFNHPLNNWNTLSVTNMFRSFYGASSFDQDLGSWKLGNVTNVGEMLNNSGMSCMNYSYTLNGWSANPATPSNLTLGANSLQYGLNAVTSRNHLINTKGWTITGDASSGTICLPFASTDYFITKWQLLAGQTTITFNAETSGDVIYAWTTVPAGNSGSGIFNGNSSITLTGFPAGAAIELLISPVNLQRFHINLGPDRNRLQNIKQWGTVNWTSMENMFYGCTVVQMSATDSPDLSLVSNMSGMFWNASSFNGSVNAWNTSNVTNMSRLFQGALAFNQPLSNWNTSNVTDMQYMFSGASVFNQNLNNWSTYNVVNMNNMFSNASAFNQPLGNWNTANVTNMASMFSMASNFNQPIGAWNTGNIATMSGMFMSAVNFNQNISSWNTANVTNMYVMFGFASSFNQPIGNWNTANVTSMAAMFLNAVAFNQPIGGWNTSSVNAMFDMFNGATSFNQPLNNWNTTAVSQMQNMFLGATSFDQVLGSWTIASFTNLSQMLSNCGMSCEHYSQTLYEWSVNPGIPSGLNLGANGLFYGTNIVAQRDHLINNLGWTITGDSPSGGNCSFLTAADYYITRWTIPPGQTSISFGVVTNGTVDYTWETIPAGASGSGSFSGAGNYATISGLPSTGVTFRLKMSPTHLQQHFMGSGGSSQYLMDVEQWGTVNWTNMHLMFPLCSSLQITASDEPDLSNVTDMSFMFYGCVNFNSNINSWNTSNVTNMSGMFSYTTSFNQPLGNWNTSNVTNMTYMFQDASSFNQDLSNWNTSNVTSMAYMFDDAPSFNQPIGNWNTNNLTNTALMFFGAASFDQPIGNWNMGSVTTMHGMFWGASAFDQPIDSWNTSSVSNTVFMFRNATSFNQPLDNWNTSSITNMQGMFWGATSFDQPLPNWSTSNVSNMFNLFENATSFNQTLENWDLSSVTGLNQMLTNCGMDCYNYSQTLIGWSANSSTPDNISLGATSLSYGTLAVVARNQLINNKGWVISGDAPSVSSCAPLTAADYFITRWNLPAGQTMIRFNAATNGPVSYTWETVPVGASGSGTFSSASPVTISGLPAGATIRLSIEPMNMQRFYILNGPDRLLLEDVEQWGTTQWTEMEFMFYGCENLQCSATDSPDLSNVNSMDAMFAGCQSFNSPIDGWNTLNVTLMQNMFFGASSFNQPIGSWNTSNVTDMRQMFLGATSFNQSLGNWNTGSVINMKSMFQDADSFNQPIGSWNTSNVTDMSSMFEHAFSFNQPIELWNTANVSNMSEMFREASAFNQPIGNWNTSNVTNMTRMLYEAYSFNQPLGNWNLSGTSNSSQNLQQMLTLCGMDCQNYSATIIGWSSNPSTPVGLVFGADGLTYGTNAVAARTNLDITKGWLITGDSPSGTNCAPPTPADNFITRWNLPATQTIIRFNAATTGPVNYTWETVPAGSSGSGTFTSGNPVTISGLPAGSTIRIIIEPTHLQRFYIGNGPDRMLLMDVEQWGYTSWTSMEDMFMGCSNIHVTAMDAPDLSNVSSMASMFWGASSFNESINHWDVSNVSDMNHLLYYTLAYNQPLNNWDVTNVTNMMGMFNACSAFNQPLNTWNTGNVTNMAAMFVGAPFNQNINSWNTSNVTDMSWMFNHCSSFNQPLNNWNTASVTTMRGMFNNATSFNQPLSNWNTTNVTDMRYMFASAYAFNQPLENWNISSISVIYQMLDNCGMNCQNYSQTLIGWAADPNTPANLDFGAMGRMYGTNAVTARNTLDITKGWTINGDAPSGTDCSTTASLPEHELNIILYPNPAFDHVNIVSSAPCSAKISTSTGAILREIDIIGETTLDISTYAPGMYFLQTEKGQTIKFIKE